MGNRLTLPAAVKRLLRKESGYGCCFCGHPLYDYHHIIDYSSEPHMRPEDMMVVCPNHHRLCGDKAISENEQRKAKSRPKNIMDGKARGLLYIADRNLIIEAGGCTFRDVPTPLIYRNLAPLRIFKNELSQLEATTLFHNMDGYIIGGINRNKWSVNLQSAWDFEATSKHVLVRERSGLVTFELDARRETIFIKGHWRSDEGKVRISKTKFLINGRTLFKGGATFHRSNIGIMIT